jgi:phosphatidylserine/phosphatidylglycerophosphate/cardiolipin synthase-like enzyme
MNYLIILLLSFAALPASGQRAVSPNIELVESVPVETVLDNPDIRNTHEVWLEMINGAKKSLDIEQFYISPQQGEPLDDILRAVTEAGTRGVAVRCIVDSRMYKTYPATADTLGKQKNISVRIIDFGRLAGGVQHSKYFIVDGGEVFLGSQNFDWRALKHIHELGVRIRNDDVAEFYNDIFELDWQLAATNNPKNISSLLQKKRYRIPAWIPGDRGDTVWMFPTASPRGLLPDTSRWDEPNIIGMINGARTEVVLQFLSYSTTGRDKSHYDTLDNALRRAASRGVRVKLIASDWEKGTPSDAPLKQLSGIPNIEVKFSAIPEWSGGYISYSRVEHCKYICVDASTFWLGTSNAEKSYFHSARNLGIIIQHAKLAQTMRDIFMKSWDGPYTELVKPEGEYRARRHGE